MLDYFAIFTKGGALLWTLHLTTALKSNPIEALNALIRTCLLEERSSDSVFTFAPKTGASQSLKWTFHNGLGLVFVAVYQKTLSLLYVDELLQRVKDAFIEEYTPGSYAYSHFNDKFAKILRDCESRADTARRAAAQPKAVAPAAAKAATIKAGAQNGKPSNGKLTPQRRSSSEGDSDGGHSSGSSGTAAAAGASSSAEHSAGSDEEGAANGDSTAEAGFDMSKLKAVSRKALGGPPGRRHAAAAAARRAAEEKEKEKVVAKSASQKGKKEGRVWTGLGRKTEEDVGRIDYTEGAPAEANGSGMAAVELGASRMEEEEPEYEEEFDDEEFKAGAKANGDAAPAKRGLLGSFMSKLALSVVGSNALTAADLAPALEDMKRKLMERNVAEEIAGQVVDSVAHSLEGQKLSSFTGVSQFVRKAFEEALSGILNKRQVDVLHDIKRSKARGKPYVIVFCGVNGVGKSTNLAKIAYWLGQQGFKVQLAACDTFRAGAVEQLKTHAARLQVPLYERGYEKDPAKVAAEAIRVAERDGRDVVLVDTAGRMQVGCREQRLPPWCVGVLFETFRCYIFGSSAVIVVEV
eukprot:GHUV01008587.1.p1 GENE.GHUV01008587.1~~GHUV01008587.1.p1  ORF type:complete len:579 (+),score=230.88 GHUV01008587.1:233-1969(+)